jgi:hypothetical protein
MSKVVGVPSSAAAFPWEAKAAIIAFSLLAMQQVHDGYLFCLGESGLGLRKLQSASVILFILYVTLAVGLAKGNKWAWWLSLILVGGMAALHLRDTLEPIRMILYGEPRRTAQVASGAIDCDIAEPPDFFRAAWLISQNVLMAAIPILLMMGRLRQILVGNSRPPLEAPIP